MIIIAMLIGVGLSVTVTCRNGITICVFGDYVSVVDILPPFRPRF